MITNRGISLLFRCGASVEDVTQSMKSTYQHPSWRQQLKLLVHHTYAYQTNEMIYLLLRHAAIFFLMSMLLSLSIFFRTANKRHPSPFLYSSAFTEMKASE